MVATIFVLVDSFLNLENIIMERIIYKWVLQGIA